MQVFIITIIENPPKLEPAWPSRHILVAPKMASAVILHWRDHRNTALSLRPFHTPGQLNQINDYIPSFTS